MLSGVYERRSAWEGQRGEMEVGWGDAEERGDLKEGKWQKRAETRFIPTSISSFLFFFALFLARDGEISFCFCELRGVGEEGGWK